MTIENERKDGVKKDDQEQKPDNGSNNDASLARQGPPEKFTLLFEEYKALKEKADLADRYLDKLVRLQAETENIKKRLAKEKEEFVKFANTGLISEFVGILDDFKRAIDSAEKNHDTKLLLEGVKMITKHLQDVLKNQGLSMIDQAGVAFDHDKHEAVEWVESEGCKENTIVEVLRNGYMINGRVIRPAMVKVSKVKEGSKNG